MYHITLYNKYNKHGVNEMKHLTKQCKSIEQANKYLSSIGLDGLGCDPEFFYGDHDVDCWLDSSETKGASVWITKTFEVLVTKYTKRDIEKLEKELE